MYHYSYIASWVKLQINICTSSLTSDLPVLVADAVGIVVDDIVANTAEDTAVGAENTPEDILVTVWSVKGESNMVISVMIQYS